MRKISVVLAIITMALTLCSGAQATSWSSFKSATFSGIYVLPTLSSGLTEYTITLDPGATITFGGIDYQVEWIGGFYVNSLLSTESFGAAEATGQNDWGWDQDPTHGPTFDSVGWKCSGDADRLQANVGAVKKFYFSNFDLGTTAVNPGFHIGYLDNKGKAQTDFFTGSTVPEPSGLQAGIAFLSLAGGMVGRGIRRRIRK